MTDERTGSALTDPTYGARDCVPARDCARGTVTSTAFVKAPQRRVAALLTDFFANKLGERCAYIPSAPLHLTLALTARLILPIHTQLHVPLTTH